MALKIGKHDSYTLSLVQVGTFKVGRQEWVLYRKDGAPPSEWTNYKLAIKGRCMHKANYHLSHNGERLANSRDALLLKEHRPKLYELACSTITANQ
jgi:hypothetical protein